MVSPPSVSEKKNCCGQLKGWGQSLSTLRQIETSSTKSVAADIRQNSEKRSISRSGRKYSRRADWTERAVLCVVLTFVDCTSPNTLQQDTTSDKKKQKQMICQFLFVRFTIIFYLHNNLVSPSQSYFFDA